MNSAGVPWIRARGPAYAGAVLAVVVASVTTTVIAPWVTPSLSLLFFPAVIIPAMYGGYGPALLATFLSTTSLAYFFIPPVYSFQIGVDDAIRLTVFAAVSCATAWLSSARRRAEASQRRSVKELEHALTTLQKVSDWPILIGPDMGTSVHGMLAHAAGIMDARSAAVAWETDDEPWVYIAATTEPNAIAKEQSTTFGEWQSGPVHPEIGRRLADPSPAMAAFHTEEVSGRVFFAGVDAVAADTRATVTLVSHEIGSSLSQMHLADQVRHLAIREDRIRVSRDLHDGVLQALTGIRLELQDIVADGDPAADRLLALERALSIEQRELRLFIDGLQPTGNEQAESGPLVTLLDEMRGTFAAEWRVPMSLRVTPIDLSLPRATEQAVRLMIHEAVSNALKHGHPSRVYIHIDATASGLRMVVTDDGRGFAFRGRLEHDELARANVGPVSLRERVAALNGRLAVESMPTGSRVEIVIPIAAHT